MNDIMPDIPSTQAIVEPPAAQMIVIVPVIIEKMIDIPEPHGFISEEARIEALKE